MPRLPNRFSAYPESVVLDGSGNGTIRFQATGQNIRITNLYVSVATRTLQSRCTMYKGQIGPAYAIKSTQSGSTGASATGSIDLLDGEAVYVVWEGGDAGAVATATFSGSLLPFDYKSQDGQSFLWDDPIAAGDGSLIYPGLQSIDYVTGVSGWRISRSGDVEFNGGTFRGSLTVRVPSGPNAGRGVTLTPSTGQIIIHPADPVNIDLTSNGVLSAYTLDNPTIGYGGLLFTSPSVEGLPQGRMDLVGPSIDGENPYLQVQADLIVGSPRFTLAGMDQGRGLHYIDGDSASSAFVTTEDVVFLTGSIDFNANRMYKVDLTGRINQNTNGTGPLLRLRKNSLAGAELIAIGRTPITGNGEYAMPGSVYFVTGNSPVTCQIAVTLTASAGSTRWVGPRTISFWDVTNDTPNAAPLASWLSTLT